MSGAEPTLELETELLLSGADLVIGCDEVGRGAVAGPVAVGLCVLDQITLESKTEPAGVRDSKLLSPTLRERLSPQIHAWVTESAVGFASAAEIDEFGIIQALGLAASRGLDAIQSKISLRNCAMILDGKHDWLAPIAPNGTRVVTRVKADRDCLLVAAASVIAKVERDQLMIAEDERHPEYGWARNKGYGAASHFDAIARFGATELHRRTWLRNIPTTA